jgi:formylglycine-generating enzyme required for sulfatase activity
MRSLASVLLALLCWLTLAPDTVADGRRYALVVGVQKYRINQPLADLTWTTNDADELAQVLKGGGYNVVLMTTAVARVEGQEHLAPTSDNIRDQLTTMLAAPDLDDDDVILLAFAGHGVEFDFVDGTGDTETRTPRFYFCPADTDLLGINTANQLTDRNNLIEVTELYSRLDNCSAGGKLLLVDACRNDPSRKPLKRNPLAALPKLPPPPGGTAAFLSCSSNETSIEDRDLKHGVFLHHVIEALRGDADTSTAKDRPDGKITLTELTGYASAKTFDFVREKHNSKQTPELKGQFRLNIPIIEVRNSLTPQLFSESLKIQFARIPAGTFQMGSRENEAGHQSDEGPEHTVRISRDFRMSIHEVTRGQFAAFVRDTGYRTEAETGGKASFGFDEATGDFDSDPKYNWRNPGFAQTDDHPVVLVSWNDAKAFCEWLSRKDNRTYRLPTEAEWEYACRGGTSTRFWHGNDDEGLANVANVADGTAKQKYNSWTTIAAPDGYVVTAPVGRFPPNPFGLHDMHGNVWEWCADWYDSSYYGTSPGVDPQGPSSGSSRVLRGGSWSHEPIGVRCAFRDDSTPDYRYGGSGFRLVLE